MKQAPFEMFLDRLDPTWRGDQLTFFRLLAATGTEAVPELAERVHRASCPAALRQLALEAAYYYPWSEWLPTINRLLRHEKDLAAFETGARALGRMRTPQALAALRELGPSRASADCRAILDRVLHESDPAEAFQHHYARLLEGSARPVEANEGAHQLAKLLSADSLDPLKALLKHPDLLVFRHGLRLLGQVPSSEAAECLLGCLEGACRDLQEDREVRQLLTAFRTLPRPDVQAKALELLVPRVETQAPEISAELASGQPPRLRSAAHAFLETGPSLRDTFLAEVLLASLEEKPAHLARHLGQAADQAQQRTRRLEFTLDTAAQGLADLAGHGFIAADRLPHPLAEVLRTTSGRAGVAAALARVVPATDTVLLDLLLDESDGTLRSAALEVLGGRREPALTAAIAKLRRDPIADLAQRALWHLGHLPDPEAMGREFLAQADPEEILVGLRFIALHHLEGLLPDLLQMVDSETREALLVATLETLGALRSRAAVEPLLALLHSGQPPRIQVALAEALRDIGDAEAAMALCGRAIELKTPELHTLAVEALARAHGSSDRALPLRASQTLLTAIRGGWAGPSPWARRRRIGEALVALQLERKADWAEPVALIQETLAEKRNPGSVPSEDLAHLNTCGRTLAQRLQG
jgi:hypothetical protein